MLGRRDGENHELELGGRCDGAMEGGSVPAEFWFALHVFPCLLITKAPTLPYLTSTYSAPLEPQLLANRTASRFGEVLFGLCSVKSFCLCDLDATR